MLRTRDLESGEELTIVYYPRADVVTINGRRVTQSQEFEALLGKTVFQQTQSNNLYVVASDSLSELYW